MASRKNIGNSGFSLIEISLVIVIIAILIGMVVFSTRTRMDAARIFMTKSRMQTVMDAIDRYVEQYGHLPCPVGPTLKRDSAKYGVGDDLSDTGDCDDNDGDGDLIYQSTNVAKGSVPFKALGLDSQSGVDGWGVRFDYVVNQPYTTVADYVSTDMTYYDEFSVYDQGGDNMTFQKDVAYVLVSHGPDTYGGFRDKDGNKITTVGASADEKTNASDSKPFFTQYLPTNSNDDIVVYKTRWQLPKYINQ